MEKTDSKKSLILKDAAIVLLVALMVLTFMSNSLMSHFLPQVEVSTVGSGTLSAAIRGTGRVTSAGSAQINSHAARTVKTVEVKEGQRLKKGDLLFTFEHVQDGEVEAELEILDQLFAEYNNYACQTPWLTDFTDKLWDVTVNGITEHIPMSKLEYYMGVSQQQMNAVPYIDASEADVFSANYSEVKATYDFAKKKIAETRLYETNAITAINSTLEYTAKRIAEQQELIKEMRGETGAGNVFAPYDCTVTHISCKTGDTVEKNQELCVVETDSSAHTLSFAVAPKLAERLTVGDTAQTGTGYMDSGVTAKLKSIKTADNGKLLTFDLEGKVFSGDELTLVLGKESAEFDLVVPATAIHTDSSGTYVLAVEAMSNRLGSQYAARRAAVEILAADDFSCAVRGRINSGDWVVVRTDSPIADGDQVKIISDGAQQ